MPLGPSTRTPHVAEAERRAQKMEDGSRPQVLMMRDGIALRIGQDKAPILQQRHRPVPMLGMPPIELSQIMEERHHRNRIVRQHPPEPPLHEIIHLNGMLRKSSPPDMMPPSPARKIPHRLELVDDFVHLGPVRGKEDGEDAGAEGYGFVCLWFIIQRTSYNYMEKREGTLS